MTKDFSLGSFIAGLILGALFVGIWLFGGDFTIPRLSSSASLDSSVIEQKLVQESGVIAVANQPAGSAVIVGSVIVPPPGVWVAVREMNGDNLGNVLGAVRVSGPSSSISIPLLRSTEPNFPYAVELYRDDGNNTFDLATDSVYIDFATGTSVIVRFTTTH